MSGEVQLAPPGAGVAFWQRWAGKYLLLPLYRRRLTWDGATGLFVREGRGLIGRSDGIDPRRLERRVLVPPQIGLEDSSRNWSYAMVLEHLTIIGRATENVIVHLCRGETPEGAVRTADLKPAGDRGAAASIAEYGAFLDGYPSRTAERGDPPRRTFDHPWFGPLDAFDWICFLPMHQRIHVRQADRILAATSSGGPE